ncbi:MAG: cbb3-type cytochrome oxidase maturation protein [Candidatus Midichloriaceae bacterium]|jgi:cbb3-type cytochrome oxidase maturation protein
MEVLFFLIPLAGILSFLGVMGIFWSVKNKQFEDLKGASERILHKNK